MYAPEEVQQDQEDYPQQQPNQVSNYYAGGEDKKGIVEQLLKTDIVNELRPLLLGEEKYKDERTDKEYWKKKEDIEPLTNSKGFNAMVSIIMTCVTPIVSTSCFDDDTIRKTILWMNTTLRSEIFSEHRNWEVRINGASRVLFIVEMVVKASMNRAKDGMTLYVIQNMGQFHETHTQQLTAPMQQQSPSFWNRVGFNPFGLFNRGMR